MQHMSSTHSVSDSHSPRGSRASKREDHITRIDLQDPRDEVTRCLNLATPNSNGSHMICASTQKGAFFMNDLRARNHVLHVPDLFGSQRGAVTTMIAGSDPY